MFSLFGSGAGGASQESRPPLTKESVRAITTKMKHHMRSIDRDIKKHEAQLAATREEARSLVQKRQLPASRIILRYSKVVEKSIERLTAARGQFESMDRAIEKSVRGLKLREVIESTTEITQHLNSLMRLPEVRESATQLAREFERLGLAQGLMDDSLESMADPDGDVNADVEREIREMQEQLGLNATQGLGSVPVHGVPLAQRNPQAMYSGAAAAEGPDMVSAGAGGASGFF